jgi:ATP-dependent Lon protease
MQQVEVKKMVENVKRDLSLLILPNIVLLPGRNIKVKLSEKAGNKIYEKMIHDDSYAVVVALKDSEAKAKYETGDFHRIGTLVKLIKRDKNKIGYTLTLDTVERIEAREIYIKDDELRVIYDLNSVVDDLDDMNKKELLKQVGKIVAETSKNFNGAEVFLEKMKTMDNIIDVIAYIMPYVNLETSERQEFLEINSLKDKSLKFMDLIIRHKESVSFQMEITSKLSQDMNDNYRKNMLRQQLKAIKEELGETEGEKKSRKKDYKKLIEESNMPEDIEEIALEELDKLKRQGDKSSEANVIQSYLDLITKLPWGKSKIEESDIKEARKILDAEHFGLDKVKERIIQHMAVMKLKKNKQGSILLFVGPPGTGKTSLGKSIAKSLNREYVRISLGGVRDEAEIRGHRRTYIGAMAGRIIQGIKKAGTRNPVFVLDEIDKLIANGQGDPSSALLEVLDPEQNNTFVDHYLDAPYDLSDVFFIATANNLATIPEALRDRMEIIEIGGYTEYEKFNIAREHLIPEVIEEHGLEESMLEIEDEVLTLVIQKYTREAGVRGLKNQLAKISRTCAEKIISANDEESYRVREDMLEDILGRETARFDRVGEINPPGVVTGLAWTPVGGDILFIEGTMMPGNGQLILTGQLGDVMKESAKISQSLVRSRLAFSLKGLALNNYDIHIHVPAGAIPKDGPSAGVTMLTAISSLVTDRSVDSKTAMTGEISLSGRVMPVGGIKEKVLAAHRSGIRKILLPKDNEIDLRDIPDYVKDDIEFLFMETVEDVLKETIGIELPKVDIVGMIADKTSEIGFKYNNKQ